MPMKQKPAHALGQSDIEVRLTKLFALSRQALDILEDLSRLPRPQLDVSKIEREPPSPPQNIRTGQLDRKSYSIKEVGALIGVGRTTIYEMIKDGELRAVKSGRRTIILARDLDSWVENLKPVQSGQ